LVASTRAVTTVPGVVGMKLCGPGWAVVVMPGVEAVSVPGSPAFETASVNRIRAPGLAAWKSAAGTWVSVRAAPGIGFHVLPESVENSQV
jgi:hypothetical protein